MALKFMETQYAYKKYLSRPLMPNNNIAFFTERSYQNTSQLYTSRAGSSAICPPHPAHGAAQLQPIHALRLRRPAHLA